MCIFLLSLDENLDFSVLYKLDKIRVKLVYAGM